MAKESNTTMDKITAQMKADGKEQGKVMNYLALSSDEQTRVAKEQKAKFIELYGVSNDVAEEMTTAYIDSAKEVNKANDYQQIADTIAKQRGLAQLSKLDELKVVMSTKLGNLGTALSEDFKQITGGLSMIAEAPGIKSLVAIVTTIASSLGTLVLLSLKRNLSEDNFFGKRIATNDEGGVDIAQTIKNFNPLAGVMSPKDPNEGPKEKKEYKTKEDGSLDLRFKENQSMMTQFQFGMGKAWEDASSKVKDSLKEAGMKLWESTEGLRNNPFTRAIGKVGKSFLDLGKRLLAGAAKLALNAAVFLVGMLASAATLLISGIAILAPFILWGLAIGALIFGILYVMNNIHKIKDNLMASWEMIKIGFQNAIDGIMLWKDKAVTGLSNVFKSIWLGIQGLMATVLQGIENGINYAISGINNFLPERFQIDEVDIGAGDMSRRVEKEKAAFEIEKQGQSEEFAKRQKDIDDSKSNNTMERAMTVVQQTNQTVNEGSKDTTIVPTGTEPQDSFAGNMALAQ